MNVIEAIEELKAKMERGEYPPDRGPDVILCSREEIPFYDALFKKQEATK